MGKFLKVGLAACAIALAAVAAAFAANGRSTASDTLVFGASSDPVILDGPLVSDGESLRVIDQIFEGLVGLKPGTTVIAPKLATSWKASNERYDLDASSSARASRSRTGRRSTRRPSASNFDRWYNFPGPLQTDAVTYYWNTVFGGFKHPITGSLGPDKSLYKGCKATGKYTAKIVSTGARRRSSAALALTNFGIASPTALKKYQADAGTVDSNGVFRPTGTFGTQHPIGTGPYMLKRGRSATSSC